MDLGLFLDASDPWIRWDWFWRHLPDFETRTLEHIQLTVIAVVLGLAIAGPLAVVAYRWRPLRDPLLAVGGLVYTIPSLALFAFLIPFTGLSIVTSEIGLVSYTILILLRNIVVGPRACQWRFAIPPRGWATGRSRNCSGSSCRWPRPPSWPASGSRP